MEPWPGRKRPWEGESLTNLRHKRREPANSPFSPQLSLSLPPQADHSSRDGEAVSQRRLPPLQIPIGDTLVEPISSISPELFATVREPALLEKTRPRSLSLFNVLQHPDWQSQKQNRPEQSIVYTRTFSLDVSPPPANIQLSRPPFGTKPAPRAATSVACCPINCRGQECPNSRRLIYELTAALTSLDTKVRITTHIDCQSPSLSPKPDQLSNQEALRWVLDQVQRLNRTLQRHTEQPSPHIVEPEFRQDPSPSMRRGQHHLEEAEEQPPPARQHPRFHSENRPFTHLASTSDDCRRNSHGSETSRTGNPVHHPTHSSASVFVPAKSPKQALHHTPLTVLPSPSSLNFPNIHSLPPISPSSTSAQISAQSAHLQDLQHQISVKTLAFQTLQREYDSLLQTLDRQKIKCATLEKKFQVSDVEINALTDEKEKLQTQVTMLEAQVEELRKSRDEARQQSVANGSQYMRIMDMANRLQSQGAEGKKKWEAEKQELEQRVRLLEEAMVTGTGKPTANTEEELRASPSQTSFVLVRNLTSSNSSQAETINVLRAEVNRLRSRTQTVELALQSVRQESISIQAAARQLLEAGDKLRNFARDAVGGGE